jgi:hypothetical protein
MAYVTKEMTKAVRTALNNKFPGIKFSVTMRDHMSIHIAIMESHTDLSVDCLNQYNPQGHLYAQINQYYLSDYVFGEWYKEIIQTMFNATASVGHPYYDRSNSQIDYFDVAYYYSLSIGKSHREWKMLK